MTHRLVEIYEFTFLFKIVKVVCQYDAACDILAWLVPDPGQPLASTKIRLALPSFSIVPVIGSILAACFS